MKERYSSIIQDFLSKRRPNCIVAPFVGAHSSGLAIVGEAPSTEEIEQHEPFVGPSGKILTAAFYLNKIGRDNVVIDNICPVGLPHGVGLKKSVINVLKPKLFERLRKHKVRVVLACGLSAIKAFIDVPGALENFRGRVFDCELEHGYTVKVIPTYHPAVLLKPQGWLGFFWYIVFDLTVALQVLRGEEPYDYKFEGELLFKVDEVESWLKNASPEITFDFEATSRNPFFSIPYCVAMSFSSDSGVCVPLKFVDPRATLNLHDLIRLLKKYDKKIIVHNAFYDIALIRKYDLESPPFFDTMYQFHNIAEYMPKGLKDLGSFFCRVPVYSFNFEAINRIKDELLGGEDWCDYYEQAFNMFYKYATLDAITTFRVAKVVREFAQKDPRAARLYKSFTHPLICELIEVSKNGLYLDRKKLQEVDQELSEQVARLNSEVKLLTGVDNVNSSKQLAPIIKESCESLGIPVKRTQKGQPSTSAEVLESLAKKYNVKFAQKILEYRKRKKLLSTYVRNFESYLDETSRVHTNFSLAETMRLKSANPALQVIPRGSVILSLFSLESFPDRAFAKVDYSSAEARVFAWFANERRLLDPTLDIHRLVASFFFKVPVENVTDEMRQAVKTIFFGKIYGSGLSLLASQLGCSLEEAQQKDREFFDSLPGFKKSMESIKESVLKNGYVQTEFGIKRSFILHKLLHNLFPESKIARQFINTAIREGYNTPSQSTVAYLTNRSLILLNKAFRRLGLRTKLVLQWHDALYFEVFRSEVWQSFDLIYKIMRAPLKKGDPFFVPIDICIGFDLLDQFKVLKFSDTVESLDDMKSKVFEKDLPQRIRWFLREE